MNYKAVPSGSILENYGQSLHIQSTLNAENTNVVRYIRFDVILLFFYYRYYEYTDRSLYGAALGWCWHQGGQSQTGYRMLHVLA